LEFWYSAWLRIFDGMRTDRYIRNGLEFKDERDNSRMVGHSVAIF